jgi:hypothetical protein
VIFTRIGSVVLGLMTLIIFDDMSDPMTEFGDGVFGVLPLWLSGWWPLVFYYSL